MTKWLIQKTNGPVTRDKELKVVTSTTAETAEQVLRDLGWVGHFNVYRLPDPVRLKGLREFKVEHR